MRKKIIFNKNNEKPRILIAPLDWGLGHATRCIPIVNKLIELNCEVWIVAEKKIFFLLKKEFPSAVFLRYKGYEIRYSKNKNLFPLTIFFQFPKIIFSIIKEKRWINLIVKENSIDAIISDNRFGMFTKQIPCVYITHQLFIKTGNQLTDVIAQKIHNYFIRKYTFCWVPDIQKNGLAGKLSHPKKVPSNVVYIGPLSRFKRIENVEIIYDLLVLISGPEPQRTIFENLILKQLESFDGKAFLIRGLPDETISFREFSHVKIKNHLQAAELKKVIQQSEIVLSRSGYTTVMDLSALQKKAILIPTPGQKEQEYLAKYLYEKQYFFCIEQKNFSLEDAINEMKGFPFKSFQFNEEQYQNTVDEFVLSIKSMNFA